MPSGALHFYFSFAMEWISFHRTQVSSDMKLVAGWATSLSAGESDWTKEFSFFQVGIDLSDAGHGQCF